MYLVAASLLLVQLGAFAVLHVRGRYSPVSQAVSDFGVGPTRRLFAAYGLIGGLGALALAAATFADGRFPLRASVCLLLLALIRPGVLAFPTDLEGTPLTRTGRLHYAFAIASFALLYMAIDVLHPVAIGQIDGPALIALSGLRRVITWSLIGVVVCLAPPLRKTFGLVERAYLLSTLLWLIVFALSLPA